MSRNGLPRSVPSFPHLRLFISAPAFHVPRSTFHVPRSAFHVPPEEGTANGRWDVAIFWGALRFHQEERDTLTGILAMVESFTFEDSTFDC